MAPPALVLERLYFHARPAERGAKDNTMTTRHTRPQIVLLSGNTHRPSKSRALAGFIGERVTHYIDADLVALDLIDAGRELGAAYFRSELTPQALSVIEAVERADAVIATSPVYKGSYPGLFKHLIDFVDVPALVGKPVLVGATGGGQRHALVVEHQFRPLFGFFSAHVAAYSVYAADSEFADGVPADDRLLERIELAAEQFAKSIGQSLPEPRVARLERVVLTSA
jgi:FMN reductase